MSDTVLAHLDANRDAIIERLIELASISSVSTDPAYQEGMNAARDLLVARLKDIGLENVRTLESEGHPAIYGEWLHAPDAPTFIVYGHYDVQPPDPLDKWTTPAFTPTIRDGRLYARGVSDDKGPSIIALETIAAFLKVEGKLPINVKVFLEGEEETSSLHLADILHANADMLRADAVISADGARWRADLPSINVGSRGNAGFEFTVTTGVKDLHSGRFGGAVPNALHVLSRLVTSLHRDDGHVAVDGFYDGIAQLSDAERKMFAEIPFDEDKFFADLNTKPTGEAGYTTLERLWARPTVEVNGMWGGYQGAGGKTVIPYEAHGKITLRLAPGQDPAHAKQAVIDHLKKHCPPGATIRFGGDRGSAAAYLVPADHPLLLAAEAALAQTTGSTPVRVRVGGTLPMTDIVQQILGIDTVMFSFSTADEDFHAPNEFFRLSAIDDGLAAWVSLVRKLGQQKPETYAAFRRDR